MIGLARTRNGKWFDSTFDAITAIVGAGVLGLPYAMSQLGWYVQVSIRMVLQFQSA